MIIVLAWSKVMFVFSSKKFDAQHQLHAQWDQQARRRKRMKHDQIMSGLCKTFINLGSVATGEWQKTTMAKLLPLLFTCTIRRVASN
jgi:uncharacterized iron-regulated protein